MQQVHVPQAGPRYWAALSIASVFGANTGDFIARYLHLGHAGGLLPLAVILAITLLLERRDRAIRQAYYWLAIIVIRTAATNLADFAASDLRIEKLWLIAALAVILVLALVLIPPAKATDAADTRSTGLPVTDATYWSVMLIAGTLGTVIGDTMSFETGIGTAPASIMLAAALAVMFMLGGTGLLANAWFYWLTIVIVRAAGTSLSDFLAHNVLGLPLSTAVTGAALIATLLVWKERPYGLRLVPSPNQRHRPAKSSSR